jgi:hypothetical protein
MLVSSGAGLAITVSAIETYTMSRALTVGSWLDLGESYQAYNSRFQIKAMY